MDNRGAAATRALLIVGGILPAVGMILGGQIIFAGIIVVFLPILGVGALMYRKMGPPPTP